MRDLARLLGTRWDYGWAEDIFEEIAAKVPAFRSMTYDLLDTYHGIELGRGDRPTPHGIEYVPHAYRPQTIPNEKM